MWIKWKYNDHGWPDFKELEIPDDLDGYESVEDYLCERRDLYIPTWSERFLTERIKWERLDLPPGELKARKVKKLQSSIAYHKAELQRLEALLAAIDPCDPC